MKEIFSKNQRFFCGFSRQYQGEQDDRADPQEESGQKTRQTPPGSPEDQQIEQRAQHQDQRHEEPQPAVPHGIAQEKKHQGGQETKQQIRQQPGPVQPQPLPKDGRQVVHESEQGTADQGAQGLQSLPSGIQAHQPRSLPIQPRRPGAFSA